MDKPTSIVVGVLLVVAIGFGIYFISNTPNTESPNTNTTETNTPDTASSGRVVFSVTDVATTMSTISEVNLKINSVEMHSATKGWINISNTARTYSLLMLNTKKESDLLVDTSVQAGSYDQIRLTLDSVAVQTTAGKTVVATLPSKQLVISTVLTVSPNLTSSVNLDFLASKSLHTTTTGGYIFAPVVKTEIKSNANVTVGTGNVVTITGGTIDDTSTVGMDTNGQVKLNFSIDPTIKLNVIGNSVTDVTNPLLLK
ncbi:MAG: DUF4382 domain-containing protein [bacterium]